LKEFRNGKEEGEEKNSQEKSSSERGSQEKNQEEEEKKVNIRKSLMLQKSHWCLGTDGFLFSLL
jgi:hypothetical protein